MWGGEVWLFGRRIARRNGLRWWIVRSFFCFCCRVSIGTITLVMLVGQAIGIFGTVALAKAVILSLMGVIALAGLGGKRFLKVNSLTTVYLFGVAWRVFFSLMCCLVVGIFMVMPWRGLNVVPDGTKVRIRGTVDRVRRPQSGGVSFRFQGFDFASSPLGSPRLVFDKKQNFKLLCQSADLPWRNASELEEGRELIIVGKILPFRERESLSGYEESLRRSGYDGRCFVDWLSLLDSSSREVLNATPAGDREGLNFSLSERSIPDIISEIIRDSVGDTDGGAMLLSMTIGTRDQVSRETEEVFRFHGLSHLLVISGYQLTQVIWLSGVIARAFIRRFWRRVDWLPSAILLPMVCGGCGLCLGAITGFEVSITRAVVGALILELVKSREGFSSLGHSLIITASILSAIWPGILFEPAGALTMSALVGILVGKAVGGEGLRGIVGAHIGALLCTSAIACIWFDPPHLGAALIAAPLAGLFSTAVFYGTLIGLFMKTIGVDSEGVFLLTMAGFADKIRVLLTKSQLFLTE